MRKGLLVLVALAAFASAASAASGPGRHRAGGFIGPYTGVATGSRDNFHHRDNGSTDPKTHVVSESTDAYHGRFLYSFRIENGVVSGTGNGDYQSATWHLEGVNGDNGSFSCDIPIHTQAYSATITGYAAGGQLFLRFKLDDNAVERNDAYDCGAHYTGFATTSHYLQESLDKALGAQAGGYVVVDQHHPRIGHLGYNETGGPDDDHYVRSGEWDLTITAPSNTGGPDAGGSGPGPSKGRNPSTRMCTIQGTPKRDVLVGTSHDDVICGLGGNDLLKGLAGNDLVFGGPGNDTIIGGPGLDNLSGNAGNDVFQAKDGARDTISGGSGHDRATIDKGKDRTQSVERRA